MIEDPSITIDQGKLQASDQVVFAIRNEGVGIIIAELVSGKDIHSKSDCGQV